MATIQVRKTRDGQTRYRVQVRLEGYPQQSRTFERKRDAMDWAKEMESGLSPTSTVFLRLPRRAVGLVERFVTTPGG